MERPALTKQIVDEVVKRFPHEPRVALLHANQLVQAGKPEEAEALLQGVEPLAGSDPELRAALAFTYDSMGEPAAAARVLAVGPQDTNNYGLRASMLANQDKQALTTLYDELKADAAAPDPQRRLLLGKIAEYLERYQEAMDAIAACPVARSAAGAAARGHALFKLGRAGPEPSAVQHCRATPAPKTRPGARPISWKPRCGSRMTTRPANRMPFARGLAAYTDDNALLYACAAHGLGAPR